MGEGFELACMQIRSRGIDISALTVEGSLVAG